jgi:hypothetical protein
MLKMLTLTHALRQSGVSQSPVSLVKEKCKLNVQVCPGLQWKNMLFRFSENAPGIFRVEICDVPIDRRIDITINLGLYVILFQSIQRKQSTFFRAVSLQ